MKGYAQLRLWQAETDVIEMGCFLKADRAKISCTVDHQQFIFFRQATLHILPVVTISVVENHCA